LNYKHIYISLITTIKTVRHCSNHMDVQLTCVSEDATAGQQSLRVRQRGRRYLCVCNTNLPNMNKLMDYLAWRWVATWQSRNASIFSEHRTKWKKSGHRTESDVRFALNRNHPNFLQLLHACEARKRWQEVQMGCAGQIVNSTPTTQIIDFMWPDLRIWTSLIFCRTSLWEIQFVKHAYTVVKLTVCMSSYRGRQHTLPSSENGQWQNCALSRWHVSD
jgi:hypothetical protein